MLGPEVVVRSCETVEPGFDAAPRRALASVPVHDSQPAGRRPVPRPLRVVDRRSARPARVAARGRRVRGRARLRGVLPQGPRRFVADAAGARVALGRRRRRRASLRDPRERVLLADGARDRRHARGGRAPASAARASCSPCCAAPTATRPGSWRRRAACASGKSATDRARPVSRHVGMRDGDADADVDGVAGGVKSAAAGCSNFVTSRLVDLLARCRRRATSSVAPVCLSMQPE